MKATININLAGYPFTIDDDAYSMLKDYLDTIRYAFETDDDPEDLAADIESRIAEILLEKENGKFRIITLEEISKVIERIGRPSDFIEIEENVMTGETPSDNSRETEQENEAPATPPPYNSQYNPQSIYTRKKLFRDPQNSLLGGVCSGLAVYLNMDVTVVRLLTVVLFFLSATTVGIAYIVLWIVVPEAVTPLQKMQMMGQDPTMENIGKTVTENYREEENKSEYHTPQTGFQKFLSDALSVFVKCLIVLGLIIGLPLLIALGAGILGCTIAICVISVGMIGGQMFDSVNEGLMVLYILFAVIGGAVTLGIPLWLLIRMAFKKKDKNVSPNTRKSLLIIWFAGIALTAVFAVKAVKKGNTLDRENSIWRTESFDPLRDIDPDDIESIKINKGKVKITTYDGKKIEIGEDKATEEIPELLKDSIVEIEAIESVTITESTAVEPIPNDSVKE